MIPVPIGPLGPPGAARRPLFVGLSDLYLFGSVLERFLGGYVTRNCFVRLMVEEIEKGYRFEWPARFGDRFLM
ncbi:MAG: type VI secretion system baseplate subunit TssF [Geobacteraceae bacterium]|nr:type VI secretion system baseplate subunit TssF [Geobacteraceae bacterium]